jgi:acetate kinase
LSATEIESLINKQSGLLGLSGLTNDMRELLDRSQEKRRPSRQISPSKFFVIAPLNTSAHI